MQYSAATTAAETAAMHDLYEKTAAMYDSYEKNEFSAYAAARA